MDAFLRDYGNLIAPTAAILNGFIAVLVGQFFKDHPIAKMALVVSAGILGSAAIGATIYSQNKVIADRKAEGSKRKDIREKLGGFIEEGNALRTQCATTLPGAQADQWTARVEGFLATELGHSYVIRDGDSTGGFPLSFSGDPVRQQLCYALYIRVWRLEEFSQQLPN